jgi:hypothetical protein
MKASAGASPEQECRPLKLQRGIPHSSSGSVAAKCREKKRHAASTLRQG